MFLFITDLAKKIESDLKTEIKTVTLNYESCPLSCISLLLLNCFGLEMSDSQSAEFFQSESAKPSEENQPLINPADWDKDEANPEEVTVRIKTSQHDIKSLYTLKSSAIIESSTERGVVTFVESFLGTGILALPYIFNSVGLIPALILLLTNGFINYYTMRLVHDVASDLDIHKVDYGRLMQRVTNRKWLRYLAEWNLHILQIGSSIPGIVYIFQYFGSMACQYNWSVFCGQIWLQAVLVLGLVLPIGSVTDMHYMAVPSAIALTFQLIFFAVFIVISMDTINDLRKGGTYSFDIFDFNVSKLPIAFATILYAYEGIGMLLDIRASVHDNRKFSKVLLWTFIACTVLYTVFGTIGKLAFGDNVNSLIFLNLDQDDNLIVFIEVMYLLGLIIAIPAGLLPITRIIEGWKSLEGFIQNKETGRKSRFKRVVLRIPILIGITLLSMVIPSFELLLGLLGGLNFTTLGFVIPVLLYNIHFKGKPEKRLRRWLNWFILIIGIVVGIMATVQSIAEMATYSSS